MNKSWLMGFDLGGSGARCTLVHTSSGEQFSAARNWQFVPAAGTYGTGFDIDLEDVWRAVGEASRSTLQRAGIDAADIGAIAVAAMRFTTVLTDAQGNALMAVPNRDARAAGECFEIADKWGESLLAANGSWPLPLHTHARLLHLRNTQADQFEKIHTVFGLGEWLNQKLSGTRAIDPSQASGSGLYSLIDDDWCWDLTDAMGFPRDIFPTITNAGASLGELGTAAADHLGLVAGLTVGMGGADTQAALLGAGVINSGASAVIAGTTAPVQQVFDAPLYDTSGAMVAARHIVPGRWVLESHCGAMGDCITTTGRILFSDSSQPELRLMAEAALSEPGAAGILSTLGAQVMNMRAPNLPVGQISLSHMSLADSTAPGQHLARALIEGCSCAVRANLELLAGTSGTLPDTLSLCGGLARSTVFSQLLANITARNITVPVQHNTTALGAAMCAGIAGGLYADFATASATLADAVTLFEPEADKAEVNAQLYATWERYRAAADAGTNPVGVDHVLPRVLREPDSANHSTHADATALVSAAFDAQSLASLREHMDVEYASFREVHRLLTGPDLVKALTGKHIFVTEVDVVDADALHQLPDLRVIAACRGDAVNVDVDACTAFGIPVLFAPGRNAVAVADLTVGFIINLARKLPAASQFLARDDCNAGNMGKMGQAFSQLQGRELWHKTIGLVGLGAVGRAVAARLAGFDAQILVADPFVTPEQAALAGCRLTDLATLLRSSDFVSLHAAVTPDTTGMIGADAFAQMKPGAFFINTARAALIDEQALVDAIESNHLAGAALDTFAVEPPGFDHPLVLHPNVISTPHSAGNTVEVADHQGRSIADALLQLLRGEKPRNILNPQVLESFSWTGDKPEPSDHALKQLREKGGPAVSDLQRDAKAAKTTAKTASGDAAVAVPIAAPAETVDKMRAIIEQFCTSMQADYDLAQFSTDQEVTLHFNVHDLGLAFFISLQRGHLVCALGAPEHSPEVQLEMRGEILDGMFTGTIDTMECAMNGEISFMGDAAKAMTLQHMNDDMVRLYQAAREAVGDPGDLSSVPRPGGTAAAAIADVVPGDIREDLVQTMQELYESQVITATGGNISVRIPDTDDEVWITPSRLFKGDLKPEVMVRINLGGESLDTGARSPSSEWCMHTRILEVKPEARAVIHAHAPNATILANTGLPFLPISTEAAFFGNIPRIPFTMPGTPELAEAVAQAMEDEWAALMINHGIIVAGRTLRRAADMVEIIERTAEVILGCYAVGKEPPVLPAADAAHFRKLGDIVA
ncbi:MAG: phosphoglycerate dehydrogenase-like enzyme/sugar (pentulose or hexulose) kinase [Bacteroidia bacterium]|jgi:phosphoglycerate dehydrogenase-like enzyme/sugar (pentulose or hexulose) kinase/ribulose-5-phosphate 4-epimerase/fuculose-1-phosphate aldolase